MSLASLPASSPVLQRLLDQAYGLVAALPLFLLSVVVVWLAWHLGDWFAGRRIFERVARGNPFLRELARTSLRGAFLLVGVLVALEIMGATALVGAVLGTAGVLGVALGFAFKDILENYLAGILMSIRQLFAPKDHVVIDGNEGIVVALTSRATILMTMEGNHLRLPNALVFRSVTLNYTRNPTRRFEFDVGVGVKEDLAAAQATGIAVLARMDGVLADPPPWAYIKSLGDSNVQVRYLGWVDQRSHDFLKVKSEAIRRTKLALEAAGMDLPEPIYRVQLAERPVEPGRPAAAAEEASASAQAAAVDTRATSDLHEQIEHDRSVRGGDDLLDADAPRE